MESLHPSSNIFSDYALAYFHFLCDHYPRSSSCLSKTILTFISSYDEDLTAFPPGFSYKPNCASNHKSLNRTSNPISFFYSNVRSLLPKADLLSNYISLYCPTVIALTETWLESSIPSSFFCPANYVPYRRDRSCKRGGGSVILVKDTLISKPLEIYSTGAERESSIDAVAVGLLLDDGRGLGILCIYRPPSSSLDDYFSMIGIIKKFFSFNLHYNIILGDFNFADICWPTSASSSQSKLFLTFCQESFLTQHIVAPTRMVSGSILDLVLSTQGTEITNIIINEEFGSSDHSIIQLSLVTRASFFSKSISKRSFKNADWDLFRRLLLPSPDWRDALSTEDVDITWAYFLSSLNAALDQVAPYSRVTVRNSVSTSKTRTALRYKRRCYHELFQKPSLETLISYKPRRSRYLYSIQEGIRCFQWRKN